MEITTRIADKTDFYQTENITREAFWNMYKPGCDEHLVLHQLRKSKCYVEKLDLVAVHEDQIVGHILTTRARVTEDNGAEHEVLCVGPVSVLPGLQHNGIGAKLMWDLISEAKKLGFKGMVLFGDPGYYRRFGFVNAAEYGITTKDGLNFDPFMVLELQENGLEQVKGRFFEDDNFSVLGDDLEEFEKQFPPKEKGAPKIRIEI